MMSSSIALRVVNKFLLEHDEFFYSLCAFVNKFFRMKNTIMCFGSLTTDKCNGVVLKHTVRYVVLAQKQNSASK